MLEVDVQAQDPRHWMKGCDRIRAHHLAVGPDARGTQARLESVAMVLERYVHPPVKFHKLVVGRGALAQHGHRCWREQQLRALALGRAGGGDGLPLGVGHPLLTN